MIIRKASFFLLLFVALLPCLAMAVDREEPTVYIIKRGDTLWGLSERFIKDPNYWPNMWSKNDEITNPHVIYPGQKVRIFSDRLVFEPGTTRGPQASATTKANEIVQDIVEQRIFTIRGSEGYLMEKDSKPSGFIIATHNDKVANGVDDIVYTDVGSSNGVRGGEKFSIFRDEGPVNHPASNEVLGKKIIPLGTLQLTDVEPHASRAIITSSWKEISSGSCLMPYRNGLPHEIALKMPVRDLRGYIVESYGGTQYIAAGDIVYIDLGSSQGAEPGNMLYIVRDITLDKIETQGRVDRLPQELLGAMVILKTGKKTATALVVKSIDAINKGDKVISQPK